MNVNRSGKLTLPGWTWLAAGLGFVMVLAAVLWPGSPPKPGSAGAARPNARSAAGLAAELKDHGVAAPAASTETDRSRVSSYKSVADPLRGMFPMGDVTANLREAVHPYREAPESFPAFGYAARLWLFTGRFVTADQVSLVPTGYRLDRRKVLALANTAAPGTILFVQSAKDPGRFAVYRPGLT